MQPLKISSLIRVPISQAKKRRLIIQKDQIGSAMMPTNDDEVPTKGVRFDSFRFVSIRSSFVSIRSSFVK